MRMGRTAAALRAWVRRNRLPRRRRRPWTESAVNGNRTCTLLATENCTGEDIAGGSSDRRIPRGRRADVEAGGCGLHAGVPIGPARSATARRPRGVLGAPVAIPWRVLATGEAGVRVDVDTGNGFRAATVAEIDRRSASSGSLISPPPTPQGGTPHDFARPWSAFVAHAVPVAVLRIPAAKPVASETRSRASS